MTVEKIHAQIVSAIWQGVAQSGVDLSSISQDEQDKLVRAVSDRVMVTMDSVLDEIVKPEAGEETAETAEADPQSDGYETILWHARPFLSLVEEYVLTNERVKVIHGLLSRRIENFELVRIQDIDFKQNVGERMMGIGDIFIRGSDPSNPDVTLRNVAKPEEVYEILRRAWMDARKRHGLQFREYM
jgi:uncharacterized glyoxalase superfamily metalloenzyme YdcJ